LFSQARKKNFNFKVEDDSQMQLGIWNQQLHVWLAAFLGGKLFIFFFYVWYNFQQNVVFQIGSFFFTSVLSFFFNWYPLQFSLNGLSDTTFRSYALLRVFGDCIPFSIFVPTCEMYCLFFYLLSILASYQLIF